MQQLLVGIDIGTTNVKAAAFTPAGKLLHVARRPTPTSRPAPDHAEHDPEGIWTAVTECLREVTRTVAGTVAGIGIASMAEAGVLVGPDGEIPYPAIAWFDKRTSTQARRLVDRMGMERIHAHTGLRAQPKHGLPKIMWLKEQQPEWIGPGYTWLSMAEFVAFRLTGQRRAAPSLAARTLAYDLAAGRWWTEVLEALELPAELFPPIVQEGESIGTVTAEAAAACALPSGVPVALAGHDHPCAALAVGLVAPGQILISTGTAETLIGVIGQPRLTPEVYASNINQGPMPLPNTVALQAGIPSSGASFEWARRELFPGLSYDEIEALAAEASDGPSGLLFLPHVNGSGAPTPDAASKAALIGLSGEASRGAIARSVLEGTAFELRRLFTAFEKLIGARFETVYVTGGHVQNQTWMQLKADILGRTLTVPDVQEATLLGAALPAEQRPALPRSRRRHDGSGAQEEDSSAKGAVYRFLRTLLCRIRAGLPGSEAAVYGLAAVVGTPGRPVRCRRWAAPRGDVQTVRPEPSVEKGRRGRCSADPTRSPRSPWPSRRTRTARLHLLSESSIDLARYPEQGKSPYPLASN